MQQFISDIQDKIEELESVHHGQEFPEQAYEVFGVQRIPVFDDTDYLDYWSIVVRGIYIRAAAFGLDKEPPPVLLGRSTAVYYLRQVSAYLETQGDKLKSVITPPVLAREWGISPEKAIGWIKSDELKARDVSNGSRPQYIIERADLATFRPPVEPKPKQTRKQSDPDVTKYY